MQSAEIAALLQAAPEEHLKRCDLAMSAIEAQRWPQAACGLRHAAAVARTWADQAVALADQCDAAGESGRLFSVVPVTLVESILPVGPLTVEALEAGLLVVANHISRNCALEMRRAVNGVIAAAANTKQVPAAPATPFPTLPVEAVLLGTGLDAASIEQGEPA